MILREFSFLLQTFLLSLVAFDKQTTYLLNKSFSSCSDANWPRFATNRVEQGVLVAAGNPGELADPFIAYMKQNSGCCHKTSVIGVKVTLMPFGITAFQLQFGIPRSWINIECNALWYLSRSCIDSSLCHQTMQFNIMSIGLTYGPPNSPKSIAVNFGIIDDPQAYPKKA